MNHRERMETCLSGAKMSQVPVALWRHFPVDDQSSDQFAAAVIAFQQQHDFDLVKVTPSSSFCLRDWGVLDQWNGSAEGTRDYTKRAVLHPDDWTKLTVLDPNKGGLASELSALQTIVHEMKPHTPVLQTIFSPMAQAKNLVGGEQLLVQMRQNPDMLHAGLKVITQSILRYLEAAIALGIDGIFYAVQHAQYGLLTPGEFAEFGKEYDMQILDACRPLWLNMLHLHGENVMFDEVRTYPVQIINWHDRHTPPSLREARQRFPGVLCGGLRRWESLVLGTPEQITAEAHEAIEATQGSRFLLGTGCVLPIISPYGNIQAARHSVEYQ